MKNLTTLTVTCDDLLVLLKVSYHSLIYVFARFVSVNQRSNYRQWLSSVTNPQSETGSEAGS